MLYTIIDVSALIILPYFIAKSMHLVQLVKKSIIVIGCDLSGLPDLDGVVAARGGDAGAVGRPGQGRDVI
ncbi:hypothetical protein KDK_51920 [Dictyobacter kobayashii]|uniref:Uncharacterized protein n=1 Tax=Dictyobacter kobayashii TaxID=2014872 RepID=A0A402AQL1_9CHLR|nr:hypothetical protein KDK_51920 [Dictyobacter kobayashii]